VIVPQTGSFALRSTAASVVLMGETADLLMVIDFLAPLRPVHWATADHRLRGTFQDVQFSVATAVSIGTSVQVNSHRHPRVTLTTDGRHRFVGDIAFDVVADRVWADATPVEGTPVPLVRFPPADPDKPPILDELYFKPEINAQQLRVFTCYARGKASGIVTLRISACLVP
jgi:hypothetical protein